MSDVETDVLDIVIVGGGLVGTTLAERLTRDQHDITLIDEALVKSLKKMSAAPKP